MNGAKLLANKAHVKKATIESMAAAELQPTIITPHALPMFRDGEEGRSMKRKREKERLDPRKSKRPDLPVTGPGRGGRVGASATQHVVQNLFRDTTRDEDVSDFFRFDVSDGSQIWGQASGGINTIDCGGGKVLQKDLSVLVRRASYRGLFRLCDLCDNAYEALETVRLHPPPLFRSATEYHSVLTATCCSLAKHY